MQRRSGQELAGVRQEVDRKGTGDDQKVDRRQTGGGLEAAMR